MLTTDQIEDEVKNWAAFLRNAAVDSFKGGKSWHLFRGVSNANHRLLPSLLVSLRNVAHARSPEAVLEFEENAWEEFATQAHRYFGQPFSASVPTKIHWWMHMQHYGAPTRLLDWSRSPFVAAYFACEKEPETDGAVWALDVRADDFSMPESFDPDAGFGKTPTRSELESLHNDFGDPQATYDLHLCNMGLRNERMVAQQGVFMLCRNAAGVHDEILLGLENVRRKPGLFKKIRIPASEKKAFMHRLRTMNIHGSSMFPGVDGLGRSISEMARFDTFPDAHDD